LQAFEAFVLGFEALDGMDGRCSPCFLKSWSVDETCAFMTAQLGVLDDEALRAHAVDGKTLFALVTEPACRGMVGILGLSKVQVYRTTSLLRN
jgi:hypothetical protein